ncbi:ATP-dependent dethiobiotin synthetase BioD 1 [mine drainage metagenome]|uniref:ATP-dependent dethiobiotin synthetase BioD 1 n=1 Tax=mine drainage metagenome TaxID=410659 RepID=A0A1J5RN46_9ZZZZ
MRCFVAGTDTDVGKTLVAAALLHKCRERGQTAAGMKPVAAGCEPRGSRLWNADVAALTAASGLALDRALVNPYLFAAPIAPHIAAAEEGIDIDLEHIANCYARLCEQAEAVVVEGAGGFLVPLGEDSDGGHLARRLGLPVLLVVGMRLGCINHALLTQEAIAARGLTLAGWVANRVDPGMERIDANLAALKSRLRAPLLGVIPFLDRPEAAAAARHLELPSPSN